MIAPSAIVSPDATIGTDVRIDPFAIVEADVVIGDRSWLHSHCVIHSHTRVGCDNRIYESAVLGGDPQSKTYAGEPTRLDIGDRNCIREMVTVSRGTEPGAVTRIGSDNMIMAYSHIAHDCQVGDHCVFANGTNIAGHVSVGDYAFLGGFTLIHQKCRVGSYSITGISTVLRQDAPPYMMINGDPARVVSVNQIGLKRHHFGPISMAALKQLYRLYFTECLKTDAVLERLNEEMRHNQCVQEFFRFVNTSERGVVR